MPIILFFLIFAGLVTLASGEAAGWVFLLIGGVPFAAAMLAIYASRDR